MKEKIKCSLIFLCCCGFCAAQQVVPSGGYDVKSEISFNWVLGGNLSAVPGNNLNAINHPDQEPLEESEISLKIYPNPAVDFINIEINNVDSGQLILELFDDSGVKIINQKFVNLSVLQVSISDLPCGIYVLKVILPDNDQPLKVEKIVKLKNNTL